MEGDHKETTFQWLHAYYTLYKSVKKSHSRYNEKRFDVYMGDYVKHAKNRFKREQSAIAKTKGEKRKNEKNEEVESEGDEDESQEDESEDDDGSENEEGDDDE